MKVTRFGRLGFAERNILFRGWTRILEVTPEKKPFENDAAKMNGNGGNAWSSFNGSTTGGRDCRVRARALSRWTRTARFGTIKLSESSSTPGTTRLARCWRAEYLVAHESDGTVREYDGAGKIVWEYEVPLFGKERKGGHGPEAFGNSVFSAARLANRNTLIGCGNGHCVLEVTPQKEIVWKLEQNDLPGITLAWVTRVERLPNGNTRFGNCHAGPENPQFIEVTPGKKVVWTFKDFKNFGNSMPVQAVLEAKK
jgi:hypothetical protein